MKPFVERLAAGGVVAIATESFFGFLADAGRPDAVERLLSLKSRGSDKGVPLLLPNRAAWNSVVSRVPEAAGALADAFWPGALSVALAARAEVDVRLTLEARVAVRLAGASPAAELARSYGRVLTATSANHPGEPPVTRSEDVERSFAAAVAMGTLAVCKGVSPGGAPSTIVVLDGGRAWLAREGAVERSKVGRVLGASGLSLDETGPNR